MGKWRAATRRKSSAQATHHPVFCENRLSRLSSGNRAIRVSFHVNEGGRLAWWSRASSRPFYQPDAAAGFSRPYQRSVQSAAMRRDEVGFLWIFVMTKKDPVSGINTLVTDLDLGAFHQYHQALGEFVSVFSEVETNLLSALWYLAGVESPTAQAVLTGHTVEGAISLINRLGDAEQWPESRKQQFKKFADHLGLINKLRNDILHNGSNWTSSQTWTVTNRHFAHIPSRIRSYPVAAKVLRNARRDLQKIEGDLILFAWGHAMPAPALRNFQHASLQPWLYTPPAGFDLPQTSQKTPRKQPDRPKSSRASRRREAMKKYQKT